MRTVMKMSDLKKEWGFPSDIDRNKTVAVQIKPNKSIVILYTTKKGDNEWMGIAGSEMCDRFETGLYIINP